MSLVAGTVTISNTGVVSGGDLARSIFDAHKPKMDAGLNLMSNVDTPRADLSGKTIRANVYLGAADLFNSIAAGVVSYVTSNAVIAMSSGFAHVTTESLGLTTAFGAPISPPVAPVDIPLTGTGTLS